MRKIAFLTVLISAVVFGCATTTEIVPAESPTPVFYGQGNASTASGALNAAKADIVRRAADKILGQAVAAANKDELDALFSPESEVNPFIVRDSMELLSREGDGGSFSASIKARVDLDALAGVLRKNSIIGGQVLPQGGKVALKNESKPVWISDSKPVAAAPAVEEEQPAAVQEPVTQEEKALELTPEELARVREYVENLSFLVYFDEDTETDPFFMKAAVSSANKYLGAQGYQFRDLDQVESIRRDQELAYEEETGRSVSMIQWIAAKLKADIYIEIAASVSSKTEKSKYYGSAAVTLNIFDSATGNGLGQAYYQTNPPAFSTVSENDALNNAMASAVYKAMPEGISIAEDGFRKTVSQGIAYELVFINTPNSKLMREFQKRMERKAKSMERTSYSKEETRYTVKYIGSVEELEFLVYDTADLVPGMENVSMVLQRGNSMTFETGM